MSTVFWVLISVFIICVIFSSSLFRALRLRSIRRANNVVTAPVIITSTTTTAPAGGYPVAVHGTTTGSLHATTYHQNTAVPMPMPQVMTNPPYPAHGPAMPQPYGAAHAYPPYPMDPTRMNPPSYDQVVSSSATQKQAPYNPNYMGN